MSPTTPQSAEDMIVDYTEMEVYMQQERLGIVDEVQVPVSPSGPPKTPQAPVDFMLDFEDMEEYLVAKASKDRENKDETDDEIVEKKDDVAVPVVTERCVFL